MARDYMNIYEYTRNHTYTNHIDKAIIKECTRVCQGVSGYARVCKGR